MSQVQLFQHPDFGSLTTYRDDNGKEFYKVHDVCLALRLVNPSQQVQRHVKQKWVYKFDDGVTHSKDALYVSEPGLYALIFRSKTVQAQKFQDWVFEEVLPKLRASGSYTIPQPTSVTEDIFAQIPTSVNSSNLEDCLLCLEHLDRTSELLDNHGAYLRNKLNAYFIKNGIDRYMTECGLIGIMVTRNTYDVTDASKVKPEYLVTKTVIKHNTAKIKRDYDNGKTIEGITIRPSSRLNITRKESAFSSHRNALKLNGIEL